jgi:hypothetical protein
MTWSPFLYAFTDERSLSVQVLNSINEGHRSAIRYSNAKLTDLLSCEYGDIMRSSGAHGKEQVYR